MPPVLDVSIGVVFVFLLFSLVVTALNEVLLSKLDLRARFLKEGLQELLPGGGKTADGKVHIRAADLLQHGLISALSRSTYDPNKKGTRGVPSYIPGKSFVLALLALVTEGKDPAQMGQLRAQIDKLASERLRKSLLALYDDAGGNLEHFKANLENWFNESMERVGGWYKRYAQQCLLGLAFLLAIACNVDSIRIIQALSTDAKLRDSLVTQAAKYADAKPVPPEAAHERIENFKTAMADLGGADLPIGWNAATTPAVPLAWLGAFTGWAITALAASLGAPFWFDTLNRFIDIRGVGRAPEEKDPTAPKKRASDAESYLATGDSEPPEKS